MPKAIVLSLVVLALFSTRGAPCEVSIPLSQTKLRFSISISGDLHTRKLWADVGAGLARYPSFGWVGAQSIYIETHSILLSRSSDSFQPQTSMPLPNYVIGTAVRSMDLGPYLARLELAAISTTRHSPEAEPTRTMLGLFSGCNQTI